MINSRERPRGFSVRLLMIRNLKRSSAYTDTDLFSKGAVFGGFKEPDIGKGKR